MTTDLKQQIDNWLQGETLEKRECEKLNVSFKEGEAIYKLTMSLQLNTNGLSKAVKASRLFATFAQGDSSENSKGDIYRFQKIVEILERDFFDEQEKTIKELTGL